MASRQMTFSRPEYAYDQNKQHTKLLFENQVLLTKTKKNSRILYIRYLYKHDSVCVWVCVRMCVVRPWMILTKDAINISLGYMFYALWNMFPNTPSCLLKHTFNTTAWRLLPILDITVDAVRHGFIKGMVKVDRWTGVSIEVFWEMIPHFSLVIVKAWKPAADNSHEETHPWCRLWFDLLESRLNWHDKRWEWQPFSSS